MTSQEEQWLLTEKYGGEKSPAFFADFKRLALGEPLGYIIGYVPFLDCTIHLDSRPLIPRPETEFWTEKAIAEIKRLKLKTPHVLDLCAGSGCIGVAVAKTIPDSIVDFSELDPKHKTTIEKNLVENEIDPKCYIVAQTSLFDAFKNEKYDFILANPPYIDSNLNRADQTVIDFEPHLALFGGRGGVEIINQLITVAPLYLNSGGQLWIEHEPEQVDQITEIATANNFKITHHKDQYEVIRYSILV